MAEKRKKKEEEKLGWQKSVLLYAHDMLYLLLIVMLLFLLVFRIIVVSGGSMRMTGWGLPASAEQHVLPYPSAGGHRRHQQGILRQRQAHCQAGHCDGRADRGH